VIFLPEMTSKPQQSSCSFGKMLIASFLGAFFAIAITTIILVVLGGVLSAAITSKLFRTQQQYVPMLNEIPTQIPANMQDMDWGEYFENQGGAPSDSGEYVNPLENL
jgi:hypothetical protein